MTAPPTPSYDLTDLPPPVLMNCWKHHAGWVRGRIAAAVAAGEPGLAALPAAMLVIGTRLMDVYVGALSPAGVADRLTTQLRAAGVADEPAFEAWLAGNAGYRVLTLPDDASNWTVRMGPRGGRYVHIHPGRWSPATLRVQANALRTAVMARALALARGAPADVRVVNEARERYLGLPAVARVSTGGIGVALKALGDVAST